MSYDYIIVPDIDYSKPNLFTPENTGDLILWAKKTTTIGIHYLQIRVYPQLMAKVLITSDGQALCWLRNGFETVEFPENMSVSSITGFKWYLHDNDNINTSYDNNMFDALHTTTCNKIDQAIRQHHGVVISKNPILFDHAINEVIVLHFVDLLIIKMHEKESKSIPRILIPSQLFSKIPHVMLDNLFNHVTNEPKAKSFDEIEKHFVLDNADLYFHVYGLWHNYSHKPIRVSCEGIDGMPRSQIVQSDENYRQF